MFYETTRAKTAKGFTACVRVYSPEGNVQKETTLEGRTKESLQKKVTAWVKQAMED